MFLNIRTAKIDQTGWMPQADMSLRWAQRLFCWFRHELAQFVSLKELLQQCISVQELRGNIVYKFINLFWEIHFFLQIKTKVYYLLQAKRV